MAPVAVEDHPAALRYKADRRVDRGRVTVVLVIRIPFVPSAHYRRRDHNFIVNAAVDSVSVCN